MTVDMEKFKILIGFSTLLIFIVISVGLIESHFTLVSREILRGILVGKSPQKQNADIAQGSESIEWCLETRFLQCNLLKNKN